MANEDYISHRVGEDPKKDFNKLSNDLGSFAITNGFPEPNKGELLAKLIRNGVKQYAADPASYFKTEA